MATFLKIAIVHAADKGGGAEGCVLSLHRSLLALGVESDLHVGYKYLDEPKVHAIPRSKPFSGALRLAREFEQSTGLQNLYSHGFRHLIRSLPEETDLVHLHSLWGSAHFADLEGIALAAARFPTVLTLHDEWMLTGHCACSFQCGRWETGCGNCPDLTIPPAVPRDATSINFARKRRVVQRSRLHITAVSRFLKGRVERSPITRGKPVSVVYNGIDTETFCPGDRIEARMSLGLPVQGRQVLLAGQAVEGINQGIAQQAAAALNQVNDLETMVILVGRSAHKVAATLKVPHRVLPYQDTTGDMARCYRAANLTLVSSEVETFGRIAAESLACSTPVITTDAGGLPEVVPHGHAGLVVPSRDIQGFVHALKELLSDLPRLERMGRNGRQWVVERFSEPIIANAYLDLYRQLVDSSRTVP